MEQRINTLGDEDVRLSKRLHLGRNVLRGFETRKVGPKDGADYVGGNYATAINLEHCQIYSQKVQKLIYLYLWI